MEDCLEGSAQLQANLYAARSLPRQQLLYAVCQGNNCEYAKLAMEGGQCMGIGGSA